MNIKRQYKLYRLGVKLPENILGAIKFAEDIIIGLKMVNLKNILSDYYIDPKPRQDKNEKYFKIYMEHTKLGVLICRKENFMDVLRTKYELNFIDIDILMGILSVKYLSLPKLHITEEFPIDHKSRYYHLEFMLGKELN